MGNSMIISDQEIIEKICSGDNEAFRILIKRYQNFAFTIAVRVTGDAMEAEEVVQDSFLKAHQSLLKFRGDSKFSTWLYRIVMNFALSRKRKNILSTTSLELQHLEFEDFLPDSEKSEKEILVNQAIGMLNPKDAGIITLYYMDEMSLEEIGVIMDLSPSNAKVSIFRARKRLGQILKELFEKKGLHV
ncbi:RNA polymerase sigma factor [Fulvivirgaceae bacterium LMO-SS25]